MNKNESGSFLALIVVFIVVLVMNAPAKLFSKVANASKDLRFYAGILLCCQCLYSVKAITYTADCA